MKIITIENEIELNGDYNIDERGNWLLVKNEYDVIRIRINKDHIIAYGNGLTNEHDELEFKE